MDTLRTVEARPIKSLGGADVRHPGQRRITQRAANPVIGVGAAQPHDTRAVNQTDPRTFRQAGIDQVDLSCLLPGQFAGQCHDPTAHRLL